MSVSQLTYGAKRAALVVVALWSLSAFAHAQQPSPAAMATAKEIVVIKGAATLFSPVIPGVIEKAKLTFLQTNPNLQKDLDAVAADLRKQATSRLSEVSDELARIYTEHFNEQELKDILVFYKSPLGQKMNQEEPKFVDQSMQFVEGWANRLSEEMLSKFRIEMKKKGHDI